jgi:mannose-1-phosphate guanylyltransferase
MIDARHQTSAPWCIVVADAAAPTWRIPEEKHGAPVQYCCFGQPTTMLQKALHRAIRVSEAGRVMVTAAEAHRSHWEGPLWYVRPEHRFVSACPGWSALTTASAVLWIAARAPLAKVTILPARCYVADEWTLTVALHRALYERPLVVDEIVTLGMTTDELALDEDYLMTRTSDGGLTSSVTVSSLDSRRWATRELARKGALIASDIYIGHASTFAALFYSYWPILTHALLRQLANSLNRHDEKRIPPNLLEDALSEAPRPFWDRPPWNAQQIFRVKPCGWSGLRSKRAILRVACPGRTIPDELDEGRAIAREC